MNLQFEKIYFKLVVKPNHVNGTLSCEVQNTVVKILISIRSRTLIN